MAIDVLVVSTGATAGWRAAACELTDSLARAGADVRAVITRPARQVRTFMLTDFAQAWAARRAAEVVSLADTGTAALDLPHGVRATARRGVLSFARTPRVPPRRP